MKILYGGDYNPEQWPEEVWRRDYELFDAAHVDTVTVGVFVWALTQPAEGVYDFTVLDRRAGVDSGQTVKLDRYGVLVMREAAP